MDLHGSRSPRTSLTSSPYSWLLFLGRSHWEGLPLAPLAWWLLQQLIDFWIFGGFWKVILGIPSRHHFFVSKQSHGHAWRLDDLGVPPHFRTPPFQTTKMNVGCTSNWGSWNGHWNHVKFGELKRGRSTKLSFNGKNIPFCHGTSNLWGQRTHVYKTPSLQFTHFFWLLSDSKYVPLPWENRQQRSLWKIGWLRSWRLHCNFNRLRPGFGGLKGLFKSLWGWLGIHDLRHLHIWVWINTYKYHF